MVSNGKIDKALKFAEKITDPSSLVDIATTLIYRDKTDKALELAGKITDQSSLVGIVKTLIYYDKTDKALELAGKITDPLSLVDIVSTLIYRDKTDKALEFAEKITGQHISKEFLAKVNEFSKEGKEFMAMISSARNIAIEQRAVEISGQVNDFTVKPDPLSILGGESSATTEIHSPTLPASNSGYISQHDSQRTIPGKNPDNMDPSYNVGFTDNLSLLQVGVHVARNAVNNVNESWINIFGENANHDRVNEAIANSKKQFKTLSQPLMEINKEIIESYELKIKIHNRKPNQSLGEEIYQLKQFKEQAEQMMKDLREAHQAAEKLKANLKDKTVIKQAHVERLEQKIAKIEQENEKFFKAIETSRDNSHALNKPKASELIALKDTSTEITQIFGGDNRITLPKLQNAEHLSLGNSKLGSFTDRLTKHPSKSPGTRLIK